MLIHQDKRLIEVYWCDNDGAWSVASLSEGDLLRLECVDASMTLDEVYEDVP